MDKHKIHQLNRINSWIANKQFPILAWIPKNRQVTISACVRQPLPTNFVIKVWYVVFAGNNWWMDLDFTYLSDKRSNKTWHLCNHVTIISPTNYMVSMPSLRWSCTSLTKRVVLWVQPKMHPTCTTKREKDTIRVSSTHLGWIPHTLSCVFLFPRSTSGVHFGCTYSIFPNQTNMPVFNFLSYQSQYLVFL